VHFDCAEHSQACREPGRPREPTDHLQRNLVSMAEQVVRATISTETLCWWRAELVGVARNRKLQNAH
jgi:hypothetical protein